MSEMPPPKAVLKPQLWVERSIEETQAVYSQWAETYEAEVTARGYHTPARIAETLAAHLTDDGRPILDFGCGTGLSGLALRAAGLAPLHGTDINPAMLAEAAPKAVYAERFLSEPGKLECAPGTYRAIVAAGVISLGAAPPETMDVVVDALAPGDLLILSFNDPTLADGRYEARLQSHITAGRMAEISRTHGPHLNDVGMKSDVILLRRL